jgi:hypothetical protein
VSSANQTFNSGENLLASKLTDAVKNTLDSLKITTAATYYSGTAEAAITSASVSGDLISGRRYRITVRIPVSSASGATGTFVVKINVRKTNVAGAIVDGGTKQEFIPAAQFAMQAAYECYYDCTGDETATFVATAQRASGASANATVIVATAADALIMEFEEVVDESPRTI